jgi:hypothetical protein
LPAVLVLSSAARIPLPGVAILRTVSSNSALELILLAVEVSRRREKPRRIAREDPQPRYCRSGMQRASNRNFVPQSVHWIRAIYTYPYHLMRPHGAGLLPTFDPLYRSG